MFIKYLVFEYNKYLFYFLLFTFYFTKQTYILYFYIKSTHKMMHKV